MGPYKQFLASDIIVTPFTVNKSFSFPYSQFATGSDGQLVGIDRFIGQSGSWDFSNLNNNPTTGTLSTQYQVLVYNSIKQLYYSNFLTSNTGDIVSQPDVIIGSNPSGDVLVGDVNSPIYDNFLQSTLVPDRNWSTGSIGVISIPSKIYGEYIVPNSFKYSTPTLDGTLIYDDGQGNLIISSSVYGIVGKGNIIYTHGLAILTNNSLMGDLGYSVDEYVTSYVTDVTCSFSSSYTIYETQYKCTIRESEFNATLNPSAQLTGSITFYSSSQFYEPGFGGQLANNVTGSYFTPYVTTVGLYDEDQNLLAIGKLAQPLPTSATTDTTILVNIDR
jgi:hypothetical protein